MRAAGGPEKAAGGPGWPAVAGFVAELGETVAFLHDHQPLPGWTVLMLRDHQEHHGRLPLERQLGVARDIARVAAAVDAVMRPRRLNYECLGNAVAHVHWHVIPRFEPPGDPEPRRTVWTRPAEWLDCGADPSARDELASRLRARLASDAGR